MQGTINMNVLLTRNKGFNTFHKGPFDPFRVDSVVGNPIWDSGGRIAMNLAFLL